MPAVAKKSAKAAASKSDDAVKKPKKQSLKKIQKTAEILAAKKLAKLKSTKAISEKLSRAPVVKKQKAKHQFDPLRLNRGVLLIKNLPKGFFEKQLKKYFSQYGEVTRLRLARSERTGGSKGYAYLEFKYPEVAKVTAEAMDGYLMFRQRLKTAYIPPEAQDHDYFKQPVRFVKQKHGKVKLVTPTTIRAAKAVKNYNKRPSAEAIENRAERSKYKLQFLEKKLAKAGINVDLSTQLYTPVKKEETSEKGVKVKKALKIEKGVKVEKAAKVEKAVKVEKAIKTEKSEKAVKTEKVEKAVKVRKNIVAPPTPEPVPAKKKSKSMETATAKTLKSKKKSATTKLSNELETPKKKVRKNFVTAPTPEPVTAKPNKKAQTTEVTTVKTLKSKKKAASNDVSNELKTPKKKVRTNFVTAPTPEPVKAKPNKKAKPAQNATQKVVAKPQNSAPKKNKQSKNKKK
ncbi:MKI67 FHA domain-interacting nucleolar phosphoprotein [Contarinia nasturtii]|uniref:MKI67 FHA domain-interacting nucleolar phosphoprotein n=1 Tax=Contarinia nasturtii TaxID=265458 RepID=UPI0012D3B97C|nr:MKI67 FHA domain-interacting nucleolar phosphoprotein [Contarinia nasturtii]